MISKIVIFSIVTLLITHWSGCIQFFIPVMLNWPEDSWISLQNLQVSERYIDVCTASIACYEIQQGKAMWYKCRPPVCDLFASEFAKWVEPVFNGGCMS